MPKRDPELLERFERARQLQRSRRSGAQEERFRLLNGYPIGTMTEAQYQAMLKGGSW